MSVFLPNKDKENKLKNCTNTASVIKRTPSYQDTKSWGKAKVKAKEPEEMTGKIAPLVA